MEDVLKYRDYADEEARLIGDVLPELGSRYRLNLEAARARNARPEGATGVPVGAAGRGLRGSDLGARSQAMAQLGSRYAAEVGRAHSQANLEREAARQAIDAKTRMENEARRQMRAQIANQLAQGFGESMQAGWEVAEPYVRQAWE